MDNTTRTAIFTGSFDPFTLGHDSIVRRALPLFDRVVIGVGVNVRKQCLYSPEKRVADIASIYTGEPKIEVRAFSDLTVDFARREGARYIIKGVRSIKDFEYEREQADINMQLEGIDTILLPAEPQYASLSSSALRELLHFGRDISAYLPKKSTGITNNQSI